MTTIRVSGLDAIDIGEERDVQKASAGAQKNP
jgi:hypothetical protein